MRIRTMIPADDGILAALVRSSLERYGLDLPGTVYFDPELDRLSSFYLGCPGRNYYVMEDETGCVVGGAGFAEFAGRENCAELQKLYLDASVQGRGLGYRLIEQAEKGAAAAGYREIYLETHHVLKTAIHMYEKLGYTRIAPPGKMVHQTMDTFMVKSLKGPVFSENELHHRAIILSEDESPQGRIIRTTYESPLGEIILAADDSALLGLWFEGQKYFLGALKQQQLIPGENEILRRTKEWLDAYFAGERPGISMALAPVGTPFQRQVWQLLCGIPYGEVTTYGALAQKMAKLMGRDSMSAQAVGGAVGHNPISVIIPCHRVVGSNGSLTGYAGGMDKKQRLLEHEGGN